MPVLKDGLGAKGVATLTRAASEAPRSGMRCPTCGNAMGLLKVEVAGRKIEIDVCEKCLSVWCDRGEFETLVPEPKPVPVGQSSLHDLARQASPETRERLAKAMLEDMPEAVDPSEIDVEDVVLDLIRLIVGAPNLWRTVKLVTPIFAVLLTLAIPIVHACAYYAWGGQYYVCSIGLAHRRPWWPLDEGMLKAGGLQFLASPLSLVSFPFLQTDGYSALLLGFLLFPVFTIVERKAGHLRFLIVLAASWATAIAGHILQICWDLQHEAYLCGIAPIALGFMAYMQAAYPYLRLRWGFKGCNVASTYLITLLMILLVDRLFGLVRSSSYVFGFLSLVGCAVVGWKLGERNRDAQDGKVSRRRKR